MMILHDFNFTSLFILHGGKLKKTHYKLIRPEIHLASKLQIISPESIMKVSMLLCLSGLFSGCSNFASKQDPAPVYSKVNTTNNSASKETQAKKDPATQINVVKDPVILQQQELVVQPQKKSSNVVVALLSKADVSYQQGNLDASVATIERALRIEPRNALLLYKLASLRLQQGQPDLAENLAKKSELLAEGNAPLKKQNWLLIAKAREQMGNSSGAEAARKKASQF